MKTYRCKHAVEALRWIDTDKNREAFADWFDAHGTLFETRGPIVLLPRGDDPPDRATPGEWVLWMDNEFVALEDEFFSREYEEIVKTPMLQLPPTLATPSPLSPSTVSGDDTAPGQRYQMLRRLGIGMCRRGEPVHRIEIALLAANLARCNPPLTGTEVRSLVHTLVERPSRTWPLDSKREILMEPLRRIDETTPIGTEVIVLSDLSGPSFMWRTRTRSEPWRLGNGTLVVAVKGKSGGYGADFVYILPEAVP